ncbi:MAG: outer membrane protein [Syntrophales bacterium]
MKKHIFPAIIIVILLAFSSVCAAQDRMGSSGPGLYFGVFGGGVFPLDMQMSNDNASLRDLDLGNGWTAGAKVGGLFLDKVLAVEIEYNHIAGTNADSQFSHTFSGTNINVSGKVAIDSVFVNFIARYPHGKIHPYIGVGPGWSWFKFKDASASSVPNALGLSTATSDDTDSTWAVQGLAGVEFDIVRNASFVLGYKYYYTKADLDSFNHTDVKFKSHIVTGGFNFYF